jgi:hypothetical protein
MSTITLAGSAPTVALSPRRPTLSSPAALTGLCVFQDPQAAMLTYPMWLYVEGFRYNLFGHANIMAAVPHSILNSRSR